MGRTGDSKKSILRSISKGDKTLSDICSELQLAPATVSQHLRELESDGMIERVDNPHIRKWKYYRISGTATSSAYGENMGYDRRRLLYYGASLVGIVIIAYVLLTQFSSGWTSASQYAPIRLTDPPHVPSGTQALQINYSSLKVHISGAGNASGWIASNSSGSINLMTLLNVSQTIGRVAIPKNASLDMIRFTISKATIEINNTVYSVTVPSANVTARLYGSSRVGNSSGILLDFSPTVATIFTNNATIFVMVPSLKAVVVPGSSATSKIGHRESLNKNESDELEAEGQKVAITSVALTKNGNSTTFSVSVRNIGNRSVEIKHVLLYGNETAIIGVHALMGQSNLEVGQARLDGLAKGDGLENVNVGQNLSNRRNELEDRVGKNSSGEREDEGVNAMNITSVVKTITHLRNINFLVGTNNTLILPFSEGQFEGRGFVLAKNASATFSFSGNIVLGNGNIKVSPIAGQSYSVVVSGEEGASANTTVTAKGS
ncbi:MAG: ArsR family transcriptional regulator [Candidatus Micrarchaeota archaeon]|nr:ArsR family transcriptional regulator [Candidatus Micrarchaeota archaeon]